MIFGKRRLDNPKDYVRLEIATALHRDVHVIPTLINGVEMPSEDDLPDDLKPLIERNGLEIDHKKFDADADRLVQGIKKILDENGDRAGPGSSDGAGTRSETEPAIFISYRRSDSQHAAGRLADRLKDEFGADSVFMDVNTIDLGVPFPERIDRAVGKCDVLVALIGDKWLESTRREFVLWTGGAGAVLASILLGVFADDIFGKKKLVTPAFIAVFETTYSDFEKTQVQLREGDQPVKASESDLIETIGVYVYVSEKHMSVKNKKRFLNKAFWQTHLRRVDLADEIKAHIGDDDYKNLVLTGNTEAVFVSDPLGGHGYVAVLIDAQGKVRRENGMPLAPKVVPFPAVYAKGPEKAKPK
jgi:TIR domain